MNEAPSPPAHDAVHPQGRTVRAELGAQDTRVPAVLTSKASSGQEQSKPGGRGCRGPVTPPAEPASPGHPQGEGSRGHAVLHQHEAGRGSSM